MDRPARPDGWELRLAAEMTDALARPWGWGTHDCATFAWRCASAMLGATAWDDLRGGYRTALGARRTLRRAGVATLAELADLRARRIPTAWARRGDLVAMLLDQSGEPGEGGEPALGVLEGPVAVFAAFPVGLRRLPVEFATAVWPVDPCRT